jgi:Mg/Co/Ni transporter MgtE
MEYPENSVGSLMATDYISFGEKMTVAETINELRRLKPESDTIYYLYVIDSRENLIGTVSLRDIIVSEPNTTLDLIMNKNVIMSMITIESTPLPKLYQSTACLPYRS